MIWFLLPIPKVQTLNFLLLFSLLIYQALQFAIGGARSYLSILSWKSFLHLLYSWWFLWPKNALSSFNFGNSKTSIHESTSVSASRNVQATAEHGFKIMNKLAYWLYLHTTNCDEWCGGVLTSYQVINLTTKVIFAKMHEKTNFQVKWEEWSYTSPVLAPFNVPKKLRAFPPSISASTILAIQSLDLTSRATLDNTRFKETCQIAKENWQSKKHCWHWIVHGLG